MAQPGVRENEVNWATFGVIGLERIPVSMPRYAFRCNDCGHRFYQFVSYAEYEQLRPVCPRCQSDAVQRRIGRVALGKSEESRFEGMVNDEMLAGLNPDDPKALGQLMRQMSAETGESLGDDFGEVVDRLERGQSPDEIEKAMPDLE